MIGQPKEIASNTEPLVWMLRNGNTVTSAAHKHTETLSDATCSSSTITRGSAVAKMRTRSAIAACTGWPTTSRLVYVSLIR